MANYSASFTDLLLAFRQAKNNLASSRGSVGKFEFAKFELELTTRIQRLQRRIRDSSWFDEIDLGKVVVVPRAAMPISTNESGVLYIGGAQPSRANLTVRLQLQPTPEFSIAEVLYMWEFGPAFEALLPDECVGYRLRRVKSDGAMDRRARHLYEHWPSAFSRYRDDPIAAAKDQLQEGRRVFVISTDVTSFFDSVDPAFLLSDLFVENLAAAAAKAGRSFSPDEFRVATRSLLRKFEEFRYLRTKFGAPDDELGIPIGALTSGLIANAALASLDDYVTTRPGVVLYRRYVDDIVIVAADNKLEAGSPDKKDLLRQFLPDYRETSEGEWFIVPSTSASFELKSEKTRVHCLVGLPGEEFLDVVQATFSVVTSERRAFMSDVERLEGEIEAIDLFDDTAGAADRIPRLRDADRFTLRRYMATAVVVGLQRAALLLDRESANEFLKERTKRLLAVLDGSWNLDEFEFVLSLLRVAQLCGCDTVINSLTRWLEDRSGPAFLGLVVNVEWRGVPLRRSVTLRALQGYLKRRSAESDASAGGIARTRGGRSSAKVVNNAALLRATGMRHLDREDDVTVFGALDRELSRSARQQYVAARKRIREQWLRADLRRLDGFLMRSSSLQEPTWLGVSAVRLFLDTKPPRFIDVARRFLARAELELPQLDSGAEIDLCVDALRGTRYARSRRPTIQIEADSDNLILDFGTPYQASHTRVILSNLLTENECFGSGALGKPVLTAKRLLRLDQTLRDIDATARQARRKRIPSIALMPELSVPRRWMREVADYAVRREIALIFGAEYQQTKSGLVNQAIGVFPAGRHAAGFVIWTKRHPARIEQELLAKEGLQLRRPDRYVRRILVHSAHAKLGVLICSELLDVGAISTLLGKLELLLVPAWNTDTPSFEHATHAVASLFLHSFVCVANNATASDSRIVSPIKEPRHEREWCRLVHRYESRTVWGDLPLAELQKIHRLGLVDISSAIPKRRSYRPLPPNWTG